MIAKVSAATVRHRHLVLVLGLLVAAANAATLGFAPTLGPRLARPLFVLALAALVLGVIVMGVRPAYFVVQPQIPAFATPGPAWTVFFALGFLGPASAHLGALVRSTRQDTLSTFDVVIDVGWIVLAALAVARAWRAHGVRLHPYGLRQTGTLDSLTLPWEALRAPKIPPPADRPSWLRMSVAEPQLVVRRGIPWSRMALRTDNVDAGFLAAVIGHYVSHPEHRAAIGSQVEYERLRAELPERDA
ncbi:hypothetical protein [Micromonospora sp. NPDC049301]|uniref:hypothetical protein n=1 Tax=Micromonospora sp. NPDC049301 TaxID=3155723 RepID=UPI003423B507